MANKCSEKQINAMGCSENQVLTGVKSSQVPLLFIRVFHLGVIS